MNNFRLIPCVLLLSGSFLLMGCGGSSQSSSNGPVTSEPARDFTPDATKLLSEASTSEELYVDSEFKFESTHSLSLRINANDAYGSPLSFVQVTLHRIGEELEEWSDEHIQDAELIGIGQTNAHGMFDRTLELTQLQDHILVSLNAVGVENKVLLSTNDAIDRNLTYTFNEL